MCPVFFSPIKFLTFLSCSLYLSVPPTLFLDKHLVEKGVKETVTECLCKCTVTLSLSLKKSVQQSEISCYFMMGCCSLSTHAFISEQHRSRGVNLCANPGTSVLLVLLYVVLQYVIIMRKIPFIMDLIIIILILSTTGEIRFLKIALTGVLSPLILK